MSFGPSDHHWMGRALSLARRGLYSTTPNPRVGCVLVRDGIVVGEGWHERAGQPHAEAIALAQAGARAAGATAYVTLEPCSHEGRTPPCAEALVKAQVARVIVAMEDPNPLVQGQGMARLRAAGLDVRVGLLAEEAGVLNRGFIRRMTEGRPWVRLKRAASLDGVTALADGQSQWITSPAARADGHHWRAQACAVLSGIGTVQADDPQLTVRDCATRRQPIKILLDSRLRVAPSARILQDPAPWIFYAHAEAATVQALQDRGCVLHACPNEAGQIDLHAVVRHLGAQGLNEIHVEAGGVLGGALVQQQLVDELLIYVAPALLGAGQPLLNLPAVADLAAVSAWQFAEIERLGPDVRLLARRSAPASN